MRRRDREVTDPAKIRAVFDEAHCCRLGFYDEGEVYIVPLSFGVCEEDGGYTLYFHGAREGRKIELIRKNPRVGFEIDTHYKLNEGETPCDYSVRFRSVIGNGAVSLVEGPDEKRGALKSIMLQNTGDEDWAFTDAMVNSVCVFKLEVEKLSCKEHL